MHQSVSLLLLMIILTVVSRNIHSSQYITSGNPYQDWSQQNNVGLIWWLITITSLYARALPLGHSLPHNKVPQSQYSQIFSTISYSPFILFIDIFVVPSLDEKGEKLHKCSYKGCEIDRWWMVDGFDSFPNNLILSDLQNLNTNHQLKNTAGYLKTIYPYWLVLTSTHDSHPPLPSILFTA